MPIDLRFYRIAPLLEARNVDEVDEVIEFVNVFGLSSAESRADLSCWELEGWSIDVWRGLLAVRATEEGHRSIQRMLERALSGQSRPDATEAPWRARIAEALAKPVDVEWTDAEASHVLAWIQEAAGAPVLHPWEHPDDWGHLFTIDLEGVALRDVLEIVAREHGRHVRVENGAIIVGERRPLETRMHSIAALLAYSDEFEDAFVDEIVHFVYGVGEDSWDDDDRCSVMRLGDLLVVRQTARNQDDIAALLAQMERALGGE